MSLTPSPNYRLAVIAKQAWSCLACRKTNFGDKCSICLKTERVKGIWPVVGLGDE